MKTQHPNVHQYLKDILNILSQIIFGKFMNTKRDIILTLLFLKWNTLYPNVYTHAHISTVGK